LKHASINNYQNQSRRRGESQTVNHCTADVNATATLPQKWHLSDKLSVLFESRHARWFPSHFCPKKVSQFYCGIL